MRLHGIALVTSGYADELSTAKNKQFIMNSMDFVALFRTIPDHNIFGTVRHSVPVPVPVPVCSQSKWVQ